MYISRAEVQDSETDIRPSKRAHTLPCSVKVAFDLGALAQRLQAASAMPRPLGLGTPRGIRAFRQATLQV